MKTYEIIEGLEQQYDKYSTEDQKVWEILFERQFEQLQELADLSYLEGIKRVGFSKNKIPNFKEVNARLRKQTGWNIHVVPGIIDQTNFFKMLSEKTFPSSTWLRKMDELDYLSEPDMFHDAFGHMPLLTNSIFCNFFQKIGDLGVKYIDHPEIIEKLGRIYWFTVEFGLIENGNGLKIYGAGILSSFGESKYSLSNEPERKPFDIVEVMNTDFDNTVIQELYFVIESFEQLSHSIEEAEAEISSFLVKQRMECNVKNITK
ncbi:MAG: phenylalanine 4-monooxygenase [Fluviicola sp.]|nr:MAG: phenylalanine 4-monooxygenase [Fluviicola sp.]